MSKRGHWSKVNCSAWRPRPAGGGVCGQNLGGGKPGLRYCWTKCPERAGRKIEPADPPLPGVFQVMQRVYGGTPCGSAEALPGWLALATVLRPICAGCEQFIGFPDDTRVECRAQAAKGSAGEGGCACVYFASGRCPQGRWAEAMREVGADPAAVAANGGLVDRRSGSGGCSGCGGQSAVTLQNNPAAMEKMLAEGQ